MAVLKVKDSSGTWLPVAPGPKGDPGPGVAAGGTSGQVLTKTSATDYATGWTTPSTGVLVLDSGAPVPVGTPSGTVIFRRV